MRPLKFFAGHFEEIVAGAALAVTIVAVAFNVLMRYLFSASQNWAEEIASMGFAWTIFVGAALVYKRAAHIGIDVLVNTLPKSWRAAISLASALFMLALNAYLAYLSLIFAISAWGKPTSILKIPYTFVDISATVGFALMTVYAVRDLLSRRARPAEKEA